MNFYKLGWALPFKSSLFRLNKSLFYLKLIINELCIFKKYSSLISPVEELMNYQRLNQLSAIEDVDMAYKIGPARGVKNNDLREGINMQLGAKNDSSETFRGSFDIADENKNEFDLGSTNSGSVDSVKEPSLTNQMYGLGQQSRSRSTLIRVYSESERSNFNDSTGARVYDDFRYRPIHHDDSRSPVGSAGGSTPFKSKRRHSSTLDEDRATTRPRPIGLHGTAGGFDDMQDEYVPDFDFSSAVSRWQSDENLHDSLLKAVGRQSAEGLPSFNNWSGYETDLSRSSSLSSSSLVLSSTHAKVAPIPLPGATGLPVASPNRVTRYESDNLYNGQQTTSTSSYYRTKPPLILTSAPGVSYRHAKRRKSGFGAESPSSPWAATSGTTLSYASSNEASFTTDEWKKFVEQLPSDFPSLPYSQRKKMLVDKFPEIDYRAMMATLKRYFLSTSKSSTRLQGDLSRRGSLASHFLSSFTPSSVPKSSDKGTVVMGYTLGKIIGFGAWGMIRECYKNTDDDDVDSDSSTVKAVKIVRFRNNSYVKEQVLKEVDIWSRLKHPNILSLITWKLDEEYAVYCLTEKISGGTLYDLVISWGEVNHSAISLPSRCEITSQLGQQVIQALSYMHSQGIVHGDVKLENCLLKANKPRHKNDWQVLLCDFGMSSEFEESAASHTEDSRDEKVESAKSDALVSSRERPPISRSVSTIIRTQQRPLRARHFTHSDSPLGVSSFPRQYGPSLTSANLSGRIPPERGSHTSFDNLQVLTFTPASAGGAAAGTKGAEVRKTTKAENNNSPNPDTHIGSLPYAAPELLEPVPSSLAPAADVWALGVMLYTMLTGKLLFKHDYEPRLRAMITAAKYDAKPLEQVCSASPACPQVMKAVKGCLIKDVNERWKLDRVEKSLRFKSPN